MVTGIAYHLTVMGRASAMIALLELIASTGSPLRCFAAPHATVGPPAVIDSALQSQPEPVARALRANVLVESGAQGQRRVASGVILKIRDHVAYIATARHVVDRAFVGGSDALRSAPAKAVQLSVQTVDHERATATVEWLAPHGIDLAIISASLASAEMREARWDRDAKPRPGDAVFTIGNPRGTGWTRTAGSLTQIREHRQDNYGFQTLQSDIPLRPGNSGGGLYDSAGRLVAINSRGLAGRDPRFPNGVGFSSSLQALLDLAPAQLRLPSKNAADAVKSH